MQPVKLQGSSGNHYGLWLTHAGFAPVPLMDSSRFLTTDAGKFRVDLLDVDPYPRKDSLYDYSEYSIRVRVEKLPDSYLWDGDNCQYQCWPTTA